MLKLLPHFSFRYFLVGLFILACNATDTFSQTHIATSSLKGFTLVQDSLDVSKKEDILYFSIRAFCPIGLKEIFIELVSPSGEQRVHQEFQINRKQKSKLLIGNIHFAKKSESGNWLVHQITIKNERGEKEIFTPELLRQFHYPSSIFVKGRYSKQ